MHHHLALLPSGALTLRPHLAAPLAAGAVKSFQAVLQLQKQPEPAALFSLVAESDSKLPEPYLFWHNFTGRWLRERCLLNTQAANTDPLKPLTDSQAKKLIDSAPLMEGAEYLTASLLQQKWLDLDNWLLQQINSTGKTFEQFMHARAPDWHVGGTLYFHLAENRDNEDLPFAFIATWQPQEAASRNKHLPLAKALEHYAGTLQKKKLQELLEPIQLAAQSSPLIEQLIESRAIYQAQAWSAHQAWLFLQEVPLLQNCGVIVRLPDWWAKRPRPQVGATLSTASKSSIGVDELLSFKVSVALNGKKLTAKEWHQVMSSESGLVSLKGQWVEVDREKLDAAMLQMQSLETLADEEGLTFAQGMRLLAGASHDLAAGNKYMGSEPWRFIDAAPALAKTLSTMRDPAQLATALPGKQLNAQLRPYQETGVRWLWHLNQLGLGACLADDMGLGKTIQVIALLLMIKKKRTAAPCLLVLPTSLLGNWKAELDTFAPSLSCCFLHKSVTDKDTLDSWSTEGLPDTTDLVLTTYGMLPRHEWLQQQLWHTVILDEAQAIKNAGTRQSKSVKRLKSHARIALTGTPVENRLSDLWSLFDFINQGLLGNFKQFASFAKALEKRETEKYTPLRKLVQPYILRRLKTDKRVISDLPDKVEVTAWCGLSKKQAGQYQQAVKELRSKLDTSDGIQRRGLVLASLSRFKQICNHPSQLTGDGEFQLTDSGKMQRLAELCDEIHARQEKVLVFTQFREMCEPLADFLQARFNRNCLILHGGTAAKKRQKLVNDFQTDDSAAFFILSLKAGGTGLNLTAASHVIHFDRWWNPAVENQATDRAYRIGQKRNVMVHKFVCRGTIEEKVDKMLQEKASLATELLEGSSGETNLTELDDDALIKLVSLDLDKAQTDMKH